RPRAAWLLLIPALALMAAIFFLPLIQSFVRSTGAPEWTIDHYVSLFTDGLTMTVLGRTAVVALLVTVITLLLGYPYAYVMTRTGPRMRGILLTIALIPFWTSVMARNFAWVILLQSDGPVEQF